MTRRLSSREQSGFALIVVLVIIMVLGILAGAFAFSMKVESRLAGNSNNDSEMEWLGRSGVEFARFVIANTGGQTGGRVTSLNQFWNTGVTSPQETNGPLSGLSLTDNELGDGRFSVRITDLDSRFNINTCSTMPPPQARAILDRAFNLIGVDGGDIPTLCDSILDWMDADDNAALNGTESDFYLTYSPSYHAKNGPLDELSELLLVRGITPELYWGPQASAHQSQWSEGNQQAWPSDQMPSYPMGMVDLFSAFGVGRVNVNTATSAVLQLVLGVDETIAGNIIRVRSGPDEVEGTDDDMPFQNPSMISGMVPGLSPQTPLPGLSFLGTQSVIFAVTVDTQIGNYRKQFMAILQRNGQQVNILQFSWK